VLFVLLVTLFYAVCHFVFHAGSVSVCEGSQGAVARPVRFSHNDIKNITAPTSLQLEWSNYRRYDALSDAMFSVIFLIFEFDTTHLKMLGPSEGLGPIVMVHH
jgi:hypothetical protein